MSLDSVLPTSNDVLNRIRDLKYAAFRGKSANPSEPVHPISDTINCHKCRKATSGGTPMALAIWEPSLTAQSNAPAERCHLRSAPQPTTPSTTPTSVRQFLRRVSDLAISSATSLGGRRSCRARSSRVDRRSPMARTFASTLLASSPRNSQNSEVLGRLNGLMASRSPCQSSLPRNSPISQLEAQARQPRAWSSNR
jgi:hypothetical protein